ncbi:MAG: hypothetical protein FWE76_06120, partial [Symbiobacteriaceae bacterium]|nr:hypothetical protein [Symbiobacteriaceae bacterium]
PFASLVYDKTGTYTYVVYQECSFTGEGIYYDPVRYELTVIVTQNEDDGLLVATPQISAGGSLDFVNTFTPEAMTLELAVSKNLRGRAMIPGEFAFSLVANVTGMEAAQGFNDEFGSVTFSGLTFTPTDVGQIYHYTMSEIAGTADGILYDAFSYQVQIVVSQDYNSGKIVPQVTYTPGLTTPAFTNRYTPPEGGAIIEGTKTMAGRDIRNREFYFVLFDSDGKEIDRAQNDASGSFYFGVYFSDEQLGVHQLTAYELAGDDERISYDDRGIEVSVTVSQDSITGKLSTEVTYDPDVPMIFANKYNPLPIEVFLPLQVIMEGRAMNEEDVTKFTLLAPDGEGGSEVYVSHNDEDGFITYSAFTFTEDDIGQVFSFKITQSDGAADRVTYDERELIVNVIIGQNQTTGDLEAFFEVTGRLLTEDEYATFINRYIPKSVELPVEIAVTLSGRGMRDAEFEFIIKDPLTGAILATANNESGGILSFTPVVFAQPGVYNLEVTQLPLDITRTVLDTKIIPLVVTVTADPVTGELQIVSAILGDSDPVFHNTYSNPPAGNPILNPVIAPVSITSPPDAGYGTGDEDPPENTLEDTSISTDDDPGVVQDPPTSDSSTEEQTPPPGQAQDQTSESTPNGDGQIEFGTPPDTGNNSDLSIPLGEGYVLPPTIEGTYVTLEGDPLEIMVFSEEGGHPLGRWVWDEEKQQWLFYDISFSMEIPSGIWIWDSDSETWTVIREVVPVFEPVLPNTGGNTALRWAVPLYGLLLLIVGLLLRRIDLINGEY